MSSEQDALIYPGERVFCDRCGEAHVAVPLAGYDAIERTPIVALEHPTKDNDVVRVGAFCHEPCRTCRAAGSVQTIRAMNGFPHCCPQQWSGTWYRCPKCGATAHESNTIELGDGTMVSHACRSCLVSMAEDPESPGRFRHLGKEFRGGDVRLLFVFCKGVAVPVAIDGVPVRKLRAQEGARPR